MECSWRIHTMILRTYYRTTTEKPLNIQCLSFSPDEAFWFSIQDPVKRTYESAYTIGQYSDTYFVKYREAKIRLSTGDLYKIDMSPFVEPKWSGNSKFLAWIDPLKSLWVYSALQRIARRLYRRSNHKVVSIHEWRQHNLEVTVKKNSEIVKVVLALDSIGFL